MPTPVKLFFKAWSFSRLTDWEKCPAAAAWSHLYKLGKFQNSAMVRGRAVHDSIDKFHLGKGKFPPECVSFKPELNKLKKLKPILGEKAKWGFDSLWKPIAFFDMERQWLRTIVDAAVMNTKKSALVVDYKTGQHRPYEVIKYKRQLKLYAPATFIQFPKAQQVDTRLWFTDAGQEETEVFDRSDLPKLIEYWNDTAAPMLADRKLKAKPSESACQWCNHRASKGGPCKVEFKR